MATNDFVVKNGLVVTDAADILSVSDASSSSDTAASIYTAGGVAVAKKAYVGTDLAVGGATTLTGDIAVNGGDITTNQATFNLVNATATAVNFAGAATTISIGAVTGTTTIRNANTVVTGDLAVNGGDVTTSATTFNLLNTTVTTGNVFGAATTISIGAATGTATINNANTVVTGDLAVNGGDVTTNQTTFNLINTTATTVNAFGAATTLELGAATGTTNVNNNLDVDGDVNIDGGDLTVSTATFNLANTTATTVNFAGAGTAVNIGAATGTLTVGNPTLTMTQGVAVNMNGANPVIASTNTGTASLFNSNITAINFGHAAAISMGATTLNTTVRGNLVVNGNTTLGDANTDLVTFNSNTANVPNSLTFTIDDAIANNVSYPVVIRHTTSGTAANNIGVGLQFVTETAAGVNRAGVNLDAIATSAANGAENFSFVVDTMTTGGTAAQALLVNNNTVTVGASSTATTVNTQLSSNLTVTTGAAGVTSNGSTVTVQGGVGGTTSGAGGAISLFGGEAATTGTGGTATFRAGNATGTNIIGADTLIDAGQGTGTGRSGQIVFRTGPGGASGAVRNSLTTVLTLTSGGLEIPGNLTVGGNFTINGTTTTVNSNTLTVDDKNIELGAVGSANFNATATITAGSAVITNLSSTANIIPGSAIVAASGVVSVGIPAGLRVVSVDSATQITVNQTLTGSGLANGAILTFSGATDFTADGGGITLRGATDKTFNWVSATGRWTSNVNISAPVLVSTVATGTAPFAVASVTRVVNLNVATAGTADTLTNGRTIAITGDLSYTSPSFNGSSNVTATSTLATVNSVPGTFAYASITVNGKGLVTAATAGTAPVTSVTGTSPIASSGGTTPTISLSANYGDTLNPYASKTAAFFLAAPTAAAGAPAFRVMAPADVPTLNQNTTGSATFLTSSNYINQAGTQTSWNLDFQNTPAGATKYGGDVNANTVNGPGGTWWIQQNFRHTNASNFWGTQVAWGWEDNANKLATRNVIAGTYGAWVYYLNSSNVGSYAVTGITATTPIVAVTTTGSVALSHANSGVTAGTYNNVTVNVTGHVTGASNATYLTAEADTLATVTGRGATTATAVSITNATASTTTTTGALKVTGGAGIGGALNVGGGVNVVGLLTATTKSFLIDHPTKEGMKLQYACLEGPENGVYVRGKLEATDIIELPEYWTGLVHSDSITVNLTPCGAGQQLYVDRIEDNKVYVVNETGKPVNCFYTVYGERKDVDKLEVEID